MRHYFLIVIVFFFFLQANSQVYTNKDVGKKYKAEIDSIKTQEYPYVLPILGSKAADKGFNLPYPAGISTQYFGQESDLIINNLQVGFNGGEKYNLDDLIRFDKAVARAQAITFRPDIWLLPFLNIYGIFGRGSASTDVGFGVWIPDSTNTPQEIISTETKVEFNATTAGFGMTPTFGVAGFWIALDMNMTWTDVPQLDNPARTFVFGPRFGKTINFKKENSNIAFWVGGFRVELNSGTSGEVKMNEVLPVDEWNSRLQEGNAKVQESQLQVNAWWEGLSSIEQKNPVNIAKYNTATAALEKAGNLLYAAESAVETASRSSIQYSMDKKPADKWNFIVGSQFQLNKHFMLRAEAGFLASRNQVTVGIQYRFGI
ncbi:MAG: hypothetical protein R2750_06795 [Bacteroidales bacterium]